VLVRESRARTVESEHRGHVVEVDQAGAIRRVAGDPQHVVMLRAAAAPFGLVALIEAGGVDAFDLAPSDLAILAGSHSGEDVHVRTLAALFRRAGISQSVLACGTEGMPLDALTASRLARDGERPGPLRHACSGPHTVMVLLSRLRGWPLETYWQDDHPVQGEIRRAVARALGLAPERLQPGIDACGVPTWAAPLAAVARAFALLAEPEAIVEGDPRRTVAPALGIVRDAMLAHPELSGGSRERLDTSLMKALPGRVISKTGLAGLRGVAIRSNGDSSARGMAIKLEAGAGQRVAGWAAAVESLAQAGVVDSQALRMLARYHRPARLDPHGRVASESVATFDLAPVGELTA